MNFRKRLFRVQFLGGLGEIIQSSRLLTDDRQKNYLIFLTLILVNVISKRDLKKA